METMKFLLIDDDEDIGALLAQYFVGFSIEMDVAHTPSVGLDMLKQQDYQVLILDVMLPEMDGFEVCKHLRASADTRLSNIPVIMLTARGDVMDRVVGLEIGADDYLPKPFEPRELLARCQSLARRSVMSTLGTDDDKTAFILHEASNKIEYQQQTLQLTDMEFQALKLLMESKEVVSRDTLQNHLKGIDAHLYSRSIDILISRLRNKLVQVTDKPIIKTLRNRGYQFVGDFE